MHIEKAKGRGISPGCRKNNKRYEKKPFGLNTDLWIWKLFHYIKKELALIILTRGECYTGKVPEVNQGFPFKSSKVCKYSTFFIYRNTAYDDRAAVRWHYQR